MDIIPEEFVSELDTFGKEVLKATVKLLEEWRRKVRRAFQFVIDYLDELGKENPEAVEYIRQRVRRRRHYVNRLEHTGKKKTRQRRKPKHGRKQGRRRTFKHEPDQENRKVEEKDQGPGGNSGSTETDL